MREDIEQLISEELDKTQPSLESIYEPINEEIQEKINQHNQRLESELVDVIQSHTEEKKDQE